LLANYWISWDQQFCRSKWRRQSRAKTVQTIANVRYHSLFRFAGVLEHVMRLCWADKIPLVLFGLITAALLALGGLLGSTDSEYCRYLRLEHPDWTSANSYCFVTAAEHWNAFFSIEWILSLKIILSTLTNGSGPLRHCSTSLAQMTWLRASISGDISVMFMKPSAHRPGSRAAEAPPTQRAERMRFC
jgi:hypothetical protein